MSELPHREISQTDTSKWWPPLGMRKNIRDSGISRETTPELKEVESFQWARLILSEIGIQKKDQNYGKQMGVLSSLYQKGEIDDLLSREQIKVRFSDFIKEGEITDELLKSYQKGVLTEELAYLFLENYFQKSDNDQYLSNIVLEFMRDRDLLPGSNQRHEAGFVVPDFMVVKETEEGNAVIQSLVEVKSSLATIIKSEKNKMQLSKFIPHLRQVLKELNDMMPYLEETFDLPLLGKNKKFIISPQLEKIMVLPGSEVDSESLFDWKIKSLPFSREQIDRLLNYITSKGLTLSKKEHYELFVPRFTEAESIKRFRSVIDSDIQSISEAISDLDLIEYYSILFFDKLPGNDEQKKLIGGFLPDTDKSNKKIMGFLTDFVHENHDNIPRIIAKHSSSRFYKTIYGHFNNPLSTALVEIRQQMIQETESKLNEEQKTIYNQIPRVSLEKLFYFLDTKNIPEYKKTFADNVKNIFRPREGNLQRDIVGDEIKAKIMREKAESVFSAEARMTESGKNDFLEQKLFDKFESMNEFFNKKFSAKYGTIDQLQFNFVLLFDRIPKSDEELILAKKYCSQEAFLKLLKEHKKIPIGDIELFKKDQKDVIDYLNNDEMAFRLLHLIKLYRTHSYWRKIGFSDVEIKLLNNMQPVKIKLKQIISHI